MFAPERPKLLVHGLTHMSRRRKRRGFGVRKLPDRLGAANLVPFAVVPFRLLSLCLRGWLSFQARNRLFVGRRSLPIVWRWIGRLPGLADPCFARLPGIVFRRFGCLPGFAYRGFEWLSGTPYRGFEWLSGIACRGFGCSLAFERLCFVRLK